MTFWPRHCYCRHCQARFEKEVGGRLPEIIDWNDPVWVAFQRARERWLAEFAGIATSTVRRLKPQASVEHQASTYPLTWRMGVAAELVPHNDFLQGDFYGDALQGSFVRKLLSNLSPNRPIGFETSISTELANCTALKPVDLLNCKAAAALADGTAFIMIDTIDPLGTLDPRVYEREGQVFGRMKPYEAYLGGERVEDIAVYFSLESKHDHADNGKDVDDPTGSPRMPHVEAVLGACKALLDAHIPFGIITRRNLSSLGGYKAILLPNVLMMDPAEVVALREYVRAGGCLYASRYTSLQTSSGMRPGDFLLADVFGVAYRGETPEKFTYISPAPGSEGLFGDYTVQHPAGFFAPQVLLQAQPGAEVIGELALPFTDPADPQRFASTHNNPPGRWTGSPAVVLNHFGQGRCLYAALDLETPESAREIFTGLLGLISGPYSIETDAPKAVEITLFHQPENRRYLLSLLNFQKELPNIPVESIRIRMRAPGRVPQQISTLPERGVLAFQTRGDQFEFSVPRLETYRMIAVEY